MSITIVFFTLGLFCSKRFITNSLDFWLGTWGLHSNIEGSTFWFLNVSDVFQKFRNYLFPALFRRGFWISQRIFFNSHCMIWLVFPFQYPWVSQLMMMGLWSCDHLSVSAFLLLLIVPKFPISWVFSEVLRRTAPGLQATSREVWFLPIIFLVLWLRMFCRDNSLSLTVFLVQPYFSVFCEKERIN